MKKIFSKLLPTSLFGRLILVFFLGILIILSLSMFLNYEERDRILLRAGGKETAYRIADTVTLLDSLNAAERERIISVINIPPQRVQLNSRPIELAIQTTTSPETSLFLQDLKLAIGSDRNIQVRLHSQESRRALQAGFGSDERVRERGHMGRTGRMGRMGEGHMGMGRHQGRSDAPQSAYEDPAAAIAYFVQVELSDGQWATFDTYVFKDDLSSSTRILLTFILILLGIALLLYLAVHWITRPLRVLSHAADALGRDINSEPLSEKGPAEIKRAAHAFNTMQMRLKNFIEDRTNIFSAMSHDLKTPITRLRLRAEMLDNEQLREQFEKDLKEMEGMVTETLSFMKGIDTAEKYQPISIMAMLESLQEDYSEVGKKITLTGSIDSPLTGAASLLKRCFENLINNALFYGHVAHITAIDRPEMLTIMIEDEGDGIPEDELKRAFEPFYRIEQSRNRQTGGTGLGLTIARNIMHAHGGKITLENGEHKGLKVTLLFPRGGSKKAH